MRIREQGFLAASAEVTVLQRLLGAAERVKHPMQQLLTDSRSTLALRCSHTRTTEVGQITKRIQHNSSGDRGRTLIATTCSGRVPVLASPHPGT